MITATHGGGKMKKGHAIHRRVLTYACMSKDALYRDFQINDHGYDSWKDRMGCH